MDEEDKTPLFLPPPAWPGLPSQLNGLAMATNGKSVRVVCGYRLAVLVFHAPWTTIFWFVLLVMNRGV